MQSITQQKPQSAAQTTKWLRRVGTTGFIFFFAKGVIWLIVAAWAVN